MNNLYVVVAVPRTLYEIYVVQTDADGLWQLQRARDAGTPLTDVLDQAELDVTRLGYDETPHSLIVAIKMTRAGVLSVLPAFLLHNGAPTKDLMP